MTLLSDNATAPIAPAPRGRLPAEVEFILSALEVGQFDGESRRAQARRTYHVCATLRLFSDTPKAQPWQLYVRDINPKGLGFVTRHRLPLGYGGLLSLPAPGGRVLSIDCTLVRCREAVQGWFEGSMYFNREQLAFDAEFLSQPS